jgi:poly-gamma-glutamate capsule biosynthesis protein CapA/YwtB (metallophosphatase superfamily)
MPIRRILPLIALAVLLPACATGDAAALAGGGAPAATSTTTSTTAAPPVATTTTTTAPATTTTTTAPPLPPIVLGFAGDTSFTHGLEARDPLGDAAALLAAPDLTLVNLETTVAEADVGTAVDKTYTFKSPPVTVDLLRAAGIDGVQLANNHTLDFGRPALLRTLELLDEGGVRHVGAGPDAASAYAPVVFEVEGWRIGVVAFSRVPCGWAGSGENTRPEVAWTCPAFLADTLRAVEEAAAVSDVTVVMVHWGIELDHCPQPYQRELAESWHRMGADLIVGGHPHVLQGVERVGDGWLINSTGNFAFPSARNTSSYSAFFEVELAADGTSAVRAHPLRIESGRPVPAAASRAGILEDLGRWSPGLRFDEAGYAVADDAPSVCG